jgi:hypothetical protein
MPVSKTIAMKDKLSAIVPKTLWDDLVQHHKWNEYDRGVGRDHSHCSNCDACNDGGCGPGTHKHKKTCSWAKLMAEMENVRCSKNAE